MSSISEQAALHLFNSIEPVAQETFQRIFTMLKAHVTPLGFEEVPGLLGDQYATCSTVGRAFVSQARVLSIYTVLPGGSIRLHISPIAGKPSNSSLRKSLEVAGRNGFGDFCYSHIEGLQQHGSSKPGSEEYSNEMEEYVGRLLQSRHFDWILRGMFWHNYEFDLRDHMVGDFNDDDLREWVRNSLKDQGLET